jgi:hypothetical protein
MVAGCSWCGGARPQSEHGSGGHEGRAVGHAYAGGVGGEKGGTPWSAPTRHMGTATAVG